MTKFTRAAHVVACLLLVPATPGIAFAKNSKCAQACDASLVDRFRACEKQTKTKADHAACDKGVASWHEQCVKKCEKKM